MATATASSQSSRSRELGYVDHEAFHDANRRQQILEAIVGETGPARSQRDEMAVLSANEERMLFLQMNCFKFLAAQRRKQAERASSSQAQRSARQATRSLETSARDVRDRIATANLRLVRAVASQVAYGREIREDLIAEGNVVLLRVVEHFDVRYGFRFSTYATRALRREMARAVRKHTRRTQQVIAVPDLEPAAPDEWESAFDREQVAMVRAILDSLPEREREIVKQRFGFRGGQKILSYRKLSAQFGVSPERVRQLVERSFERAREQFGERLGLTA